VVRGVTPFLTIYTPAYRRPRGLIALMASIQAQTWADRVQHVIAPDYAGVGLVTALFDWPATYAASVRGEYVQIVCDDDALVSPTVVESLGLLAKAHNHPDVLIVQATKAQHGTLPYEDYGPPVEGRIDLACVVTRRDVWFQHVHDYGKRYEGDYDHVRTMWDAGRRFVYTGLRMVDGKVSRGAPE
jgi:glycosyltransferase involved in cell wall biosynthesis